jgi:hypothetical protein
MPQRITSSLITLLVVVLSACAPETPAAPSSVPTRTAAPTPSLTATPSPSPTGETPVAGACELVANSETTIYERPSLDAGVFGTLSPGDRVTVGATTSDGWVGFDPGTAQAANVGVFRLRWVQRSDAISLEGACSDLPVVVGPPAGVCFTMAMEDIPIYSQPNASSTVIVTMHSGDYAKVIGTAGDWFEVDLSVGSLGLSETGWMSSQNVNFNGPCESLPLAPTPTGPAATYTDPFVYCAAVGTIDAPDERYVGPVAPEGVIEGLRKKAGIAEDAPDDWVAAGTVWRCMDGKVWACFVGANLPCSEKADTSSTPRPEMEEFCSANPNADTIPAAVTGRATIYEWRCVDGTPQIVRQVFTPDAQGFLSDFWYQLSAK